MHRDLTCVVSTRAIFPFLGVYSSFPGILSRRRHEAFRISLGNLRSYKSWRRIDRRLVRNAHRSERSPIRNSEGETDDGVLSVQLQM